MTSRPPGLCNGLTRLLGGSSPVVASQPSLSTQLQTHTHAGCLPHGPELCKHRPVAPAFTHPWHAPTLIRPLPDAPQQHSSVPCTYTARPVHAPDTHVLHPAPSYTHLPAPTTTEPTRTQLACVPPRPPRPVAGPPRPENCTLCTRTPSGDPHRSHLPSPVP